MTQTAICETLQNLGEMITVLHKIPQSVGDATLSSAAAAAASHVTGT